MRSGTRTSKPRRLSQVARHVVVPDGIVSTGWPAVRDTLTNLGISFDQWQQDLAKIALGKRRDGKYAATVGGVVLSIPRQVGKTFWAGSVIFALCLLEEGHKVIWTAHHTDTADETFLSMQMLADLPKFKPHVRRILTGGGKQRIIFRNGSRIEFGARESGFGRGKTKVSILVLDEFQHVSESALENLTPTANQGENPLLFMMGTPPRPIDRGDAFKNKRRRALGDGSKNLVYVEMSADSGADVDDRKQWAKANPSYPSRTNAESMLRMRENLASEDSFRREALGVWDEEAAAKSLISADDWAILAVDDVAVGPGSVVAGVKFSVDGATVGLAVGVRPDDGGPVHVAGIRSASTGEGLAWLVGWLRERQDSVLQVVVDGKAGVSALASALAEAGVPLRLRAKHSSGRYFREPSLAEYTGAHVEFLEAVRAEELTHGESPTLDEQVAGAMKRPVGRQGAWAWQPVSDLGDVTLLDAATLAFWGAKTVTRGKRKGVRVQ